MTHREGVTVEELLQEARRFLEQRWMEWKALNPLLEPGPTPSHNMCRFSSVFLLMLLKENGHRGWVAKGGAPAGFSSPWERTARFRMADGGLLDLQGQWQPHYWLEHKASNRLVDLTADQFGHAAVIITTPDDGRYRANYAQNAVLGHLKDARISPARWMEAWREKVALDEAPGFNHLRNS